MNGKFPEIVGRLKNVPEYSAWFDRLFPGSGVTKDNLLSAIATYERTVMAGEAPFDRWIDGNPTAISPSAQRGFMLFNGKAGCSGLPFRLELHGQSNSMTSASRPRTSGEASTNPRIRRLNTLSKHRDCAI